MKDFFISYNKADRQWAEWIAWQMRGCRLLSSNPVDAEHNIGVLSPNFLTSIFTQPEWAATFVNYPTSKNRNLLIIRVHECKSEDLLEAMGYIDLVRSWSEPLRFGQ